MSPLEEKKKLADTANSEINCEDDARAISRDQISAETPTRLDGGGSLCPGSKAARCGEERLFRASAYLAKACEGVVEWDLPENEWAALIQWAHSEQLVLDIEGPALDETREHGTRFDRAHRRWWKFTKPDMAGYTVDWSENGEPFLYNASPSEYLARIQRQNELFADDIRLEGLWKSPGGGWRIVTTQSHAEGRVGTLAEISQGMKQLGFLPLKWNGIGYEHATSWRLGRFCVGCASR